MQVIAAMIEQNAVFSALDVGVEISKEHFAGQRLRQIVHIVLQERIDLGNHLGHMVVVARIIPLLDIDLIADDNLRIRQVRRKMRDNVRDRRHHLRGS